MSEAKNESSALARTLSGLLCADYINHVEDKSDSNTQRARVYFKNGRQLSIIRGCWSFGGDKGLFEIAPFNLEGEMDESMFDEDDQGDIVCGYCTPEKVQHYIEKIGAMGA